MTPMKIENEPRISRMSADKAILVLPIRNPRHPRFSTFNLMEIACDTF